jgi:hypothetical protein
LNLSEQRWKKIIAFLKLYLSIEEWFHDANNKKGSQMRMGRNSQGTTIITPVISQKEQHKCIQSLKDAWHDKNAGVYEVVWKWHQFLWWSWRICT